MDKVILEELKFSRMMPMCIYHDDGATISIVHNQILHDRTNHIEVDEHFIKKKNDVGVICIFCPPTTEQIVYVLTKKHLMINKLEMISSNGGVLVISFSVNQYLFSLLYYIAGNLSVFICK